MLDAIRKRSGSIVITFMMAAIIFVFIFWGIGNIDGSKQRGTLAVVNGTKIAPQVYLNELSKTVNIYRNFLGEKFDRKLLEQLNLKRQALDSLITHHLVLQEAERLQLKVSDFQLRRTIESTDVFKVNGAFSAARYRDLLSANQLTPSQFEEDQRKQLLFQNVGSFIRRNVYITPSEGRANFVIDRDRANLAFIKIDPAQFSKDVQIKKEEIDRFLEEEASRKRVQEVYDLDHKDKKFEEIKSEIASQLLKEEKQTLLAEGLAAQIISLLKEKKNPKDLLTRYQLTQQETGLFTREFSFIPKVGQSEAGMKAAFQLTEGSPTMLQSFHISEMIYVFSLKERKRPDMDEFEKNAAKLLHQELDKQQTLAVNNWLDHLRDSAKIKVNEELFNSLSL